VNFAIRTFRDQQIKMRCVWVDGIRSLAFDNEGRIRIKAEDLGLLSVKRGANPIYRQRHFATALKSSNVTATGT